LQRIEAQGEMQTLRASLAEEHEAREALEQKHALCATTIADLSRHAAESDEACEALQVVVVWWWWW